MRNFRLFVPGIILAMCVGALAQETNYKLGRTPSEDEIRAWNIDISPEGKGLPPGKGTAAEGAILYAQKCAKCHGPTGEEQLYMGFCCSTRGLVPRRGPNNTPSPSWALATTLWDRINRAMPRFEEGSLSANDVYALTALILFWNGVIQGNDVMDAQSLPQVPMPNRKAFIPAPPDLKQSLSCDPQLLRCVEHWKKIAEAEKQK